jgi:hypothetical protein
VGLKAAGVGHFAIPTAPAAGTSVTSGAANTFTTTPVVLSASAPSTLFITGVHLESSAALAATYIYVQLMSGGAGAETIIGQYLVPLSTASTVALGYRQIYPPIAVTSGTRLTAKTADSVGAKATLVTLECIAQSNVVDDGVVQSANVLQWNTANVAAPATAGVPDVNVKNINNVAAATPGAAGGVLISGSNAGTTTLGALTITGATTHTGNVVFSDGLTISAPSTLNRAGLSIAGNGTGAGMSVTGGATGIGLSVVGGATSGDGVKVTTTSGHGINLAPVGSNAHGLFATGGNGGTSDGIKAAAGTGGVDFRANQTGNLVGTVSTLTTYTGNTPQTGDAYARLGAPAGASVSADVAAIQAKTANLPAAPASTTNITSASGVSLAASQHVIVDSGTVTTVTNQLTGAQVATAVWTDTTAGDFTTASSIGKSVMNGVTLGTGLTVASVSGAVGSVTGTVGSVTGNVGGNVVGSVASVTARVTANTDQLAGQTVTAAAGVTFPTSVASPTNITAGTITTVTNLTNAPTAGDFTATMKTSITTAATAATPTATLANGAHGGAAATLTLGGAGGLTATHTGNTTGSVGSVVGAVGSVTGSVGGNVTGSVGSVVGAVGSVTADVGITQAAADKAWSTATRVLTAGTNIVLAKGVGLTGLNDIAATAIVSSGAITTSAGKVSGVALVDTLTTYTGNTVQTGDSFARIGAAGAGLTALGDARIANLDATVASRSTFAGGAVASVTGAVGSVTAAVTVGTNNDKTGYTLSAAGVQANWDALTASLTAVGSVGKKLADWTIGTAQTGDSYARLGAPAGASLSADIAAVKTDTAAVKAKTNSLNFSVAGYVDANIRYVNNVLVNGNGSGGTPWGP